MLPQQASIYVCTILNPFCLRVFSLDNAGEVDAPFHWDVPAPFELSPMSGVIPAGRLTHSLFINDP